jgi:ribosomal protein S18 acetylase RimI-like enzyme
MKWWPFRQQEKHGAGPKASNGALPQTPLAEFTRLLRGAAPRSSAQAVVAAPLAAPVPSRVKGLRDLPRPALRWVGEAGRIALREFSFEEDADAVCSFQDETYALNFPDFHYTRGFAQAFRHDLRRASLDHHHGLFVLDERRDDRDEKHALAGFLWLVVCENNWTGERYGYINNIYLVPERRKQGLAQEMMRHTDDFFRARGVRRVRLTVTASNNEAAALYGRAGYRVTRWEMDKEL